MGRIRTIKPEFFRHEALYDAEIETGLPLRVAFAGLWTAADREGRFQWNPRQLKLDCLPYDDVDFSRVLDALTTRGFVVRYTENGERYFGYIPSWRKHQVINTRERHSELPEPENCKQIQCDADASSARRARVTKMHVHAQGEGEREGNKEGEGEGEDSRSLRSRASDWPSDFRERFWQQYPRKVGRKAALAALESIKRRGEIEFDVLMAGIAKIPIGDPKFIPHPTTWLRQGRWDDEVLPLNGGQHEKLSASDRAYQLAERARELERTAGVGRPDDSFGSNSESRGFVEIIPPS